MDKTPNHICKNPKCTKGADGGPKHYWACNDCDKQNSWRKATCDEECYVEYLDVIAVERGEKQALAVDVGQLSIFDDHMVVDAPVVIRDPVIGEPKVTSPPSFMGYHSKKNKHH